MKNSYPRRLLRALWRCFRLAAICWFSAFCLASAALVINAILFAYGGRGLSPAEVMAFMAWLTTPAMALMDLLLPSLAGLVRFSASLLDLSLIVELVSIAAAMLGFAWGLLLFIIELFSFPVRRAA